MFRKKKKMKIIPQNILFWILCTVMLLRCHHPDFFYYCSNYYIVLAEIPKDMLSINPMSNPFGTSSDDDSSLATVTLEDSQDKKSANPFAEQDEREKAAIPAAFKVLATIPLTDEEDTDKDNKASQRKSTNPWGYGDQESGESVNENNFNLASIDAQQGDSSEVYEAEGTVISDVTDLDQASVFSGWKAGEKGGGTRESRAIQPLVFQSKTQVAGTCFVDMKDAPEDIKEYNLDAGFWDGGVYEAVYNECEKSHIGARIAMKNKVVEAYRKNDLVTLDILWRSPIAVRVLSWLPNIQDPDSNEPHTGYFATVYLTSRPSHQWQVVARFAKFYNLHSKMKKLCYEKLFFPGGMTCPFPDDRWKSKFFGVNDEVRDKRRNGLDGWFRELAMSPQVILGTIISINF